MPRARRRRPPHLLQGAAASQSCPDLTEAVVVAAIAKAALPGLDGGVDSCVQLSASATCSTPTLTRPCEAALSRRSLRCRRGRFLLAPGPRCRHGARANREDIGGTSPYQSRESRPCRPALSRRSRRRRRGRGPSSTRPARNTSSPRARRRSTSSFDGSRVRRSPRGRSSRRHDPRASKGSRRSSVPRLSERKACPPSRCWRRASSRPSGLRPRSLRSRGENPPWCAARGACLPSRDACVTAPRWSSWRRPRASNALWVPGRRSPSRGAEGGGAPRRESSARSHEAGSCNASPRCGAAVARGSACGAASTGSSAGAPGPSAVGAPPRRASRQSSVVPGSMP